MAKSFSLTTTLCLLLLTLTLDLVSPARILDQVDPEALVPDPSTQDDLPALPPVLGSGPDLPSSGQAPIVAPVDDTTISPDQPQLSPEAPIAPTTDEVNQPQPVPVVSTAPVVAHGGHEHPAISFFMHDVLGGSQASGRIVTGIVATEGVNGIPFSKPNNQVFPVNNGVPLTNNGNINNLFNNNNAPSLASLNGQRGQNTGNNNNQAFVTPGQLPSGTTLQKLMFGSTTVIDDELTEGHELGSAVVGRGQGFYLASSLDGESHTMAFTALFHEGDHEEAADTVSFFGVHRTASPISPIAVIGGTGKYENAKGYATIETLPQENQHTTDGVDTIAQINVYLY